MIVWVGYAPNSQRLGKKARAAAGKKKGVRPRGDIWPAAYGTAVPPA